jgi:single-strand selective monofunctional uracil DNA glycosylase
MNSVDKYPGEFSKLTFGPPVAFIYNPLDYARKPYKLYLKRYGAPPKKVVLVGMNPGPWGMVQTGIPFGTVSIVREWLGIKAPVGRPAKLHPKRPVEGFACSRDEVSGARLWGWAQETYGTPARFFKDFFVANYCPLAFFDPGGRNITPDKISRGEQGPLFDLCDRMLRDIVKKLSPQFVIGIGAFSAGRVRVSLSGLDITCGRITHPSPANPKANRGWSRLVAQELREIGAG